MYWSEIITTLVSLFFGGGIIVCFEYFRDRKANKATAESNAERTASEAESASITVQDQKIDLGTKFIESMLQMKEKFDVQQAQSNSNQEEMKETLSRIEGRMNDIETYLNGPYHEWLANRK